MPTSLRACAGLNLRVRESSCLREYDKCTQAPTRKGVRDLRKMVSIVWSDLAACSLALSDRHKTGMMGALDRAALARLTFPAGSYSRKISPASSPPLRAPQSIHESSARCRRWCGVHRR